MAEKHFYYPRLDRASRSIRLLVLCPDLHPKDNGIQCKLVTAGLDATYEALSYVWGEPDNLGLKIWVNDIQVTIRKNLFPL